MKDPTEQPKYAEVLLPLAIPKLYTYSIPVDFWDEVIFGIRVEVPLRNKLYSGIVIKVHSEPPQGKTRLILSILDQEPIIKPQHFELWAWIAGYYCAHLGAVMNVALPSGLKLSSETKFVFNKRLDIDALGLSNDEFLVSEALSIQNELTIDIVQDILNKKTVYPVIRGLMEKRLLIIKEELRQRYKPKQEDYFSIASPYNDDFDRALEVVSRSEKQTRALLSIVTLSMNKRPVSRKMIYEHAEVNGTVLKALLKKGLVTMERKDVSRLDTISNGDDLSPAPLSTDQEVALKNINGGFAEDKVCLLEGVTGSGKTRIYIELISKTIQEGGQALLLLPEIALTTQIVSRLEATLGHPLLEYHSKINDQRRVEIWKAALVSNQLFIGARSAIFLPFSNLKLVIVDEEHDPSYKQQRPNPKYQARDCAIMLGRMHDANVLLGSATPSLESIANAQSKKYHYVPLKTRFGTSELPEIEIVDLKISYKKGMVREGLSLRLMEAIRETVENKEQVILFKNRRGYAPILRCSFCAWTSECPNCDVTLTYHRAINELRCHYCGFRQKKNEDCPNCGRSELDLLGIGTQKIEEFLREQFPDYKIQRFDYDTTRTKANQEKILHDFQNRRIDILVGTQMITKGFDFDHISLVGIISADGLLSFPDFRSAERTFQLLVQVSGRAGRRERPGRVIIQAFHTGHPVLKDVLENNSVHFYGRELAERQEYIFPPVFNLIAIWTIHQDFKQVKNTALRLSEVLYIKLGSRVQGPVDPPVLRIRNQYHQVIYIRFEKDAGVAKRIKGMITSAIAKIRSDKEYRRVRISVDVDPY